MMDLIDRLIERQKNEHITDGELARKLGMHRVSWQKIKHRKVPFGNKFYKAVKARYPEFFLPSGATNDLDNSSNPRNASAESLPSRLSRGLKWIIGGKE